MRAVIARVLRLAVVLSLVGAIAAPIAFPAAGRAQPQQTLAALDAGVLGKLNAVRSAHGLAPLHVSATSHVPAAARHVERGRRKGTLRCCSAEHVECSVRSASFACSAL